jgi:hypothetical protein
VSSLRWVRSVARISALLALLFGADDLDVPAANGLIFGDGPGAFISFAAAETAVTPDASPRAVTPTHSGGTLSGLFSNGGWLGGFAAGFLGSGVLGLLFGRGVIAGLGGIGGVASYVGLLFQIVLLAMLCRLFWTLWRSGAPTGAAALSSRQLADPYLRSRDDLHGSLDVGGSDTERETGSRSEEIPAPRGGRG